MNNSKKITWKQILHAIIQAAIAALTALGVTSCTVSTQFRAYPFERALFSALNRVLLKN